MQNKMGVKCLLCLWLMPLIACAQQVTIKPVQLTAEYRANPIGIGTRTPIFGWTLQSKPTSARNVRQVAYRIRMAESHVALDRGALWDSGRVASETYWQRLYTGPPLASNTKYFWKVQAWHGEGKAGPWSEPAQFTTALLSDGDWKARWIAAEPDRPLKQQSAPLPSDPPALPVFRRDFEVKKPVASALLSVAGLGQYELHLNGSNVTETVLNSGWTDYRKTIFYDTYDIRKLLHVGTNAFGLLLGNGMYNVEDVKGHYTKFAGTFGQPKCILQMQLTYKDGSSEVVSSDGLWQTRSGPVLYSSTFSGESFDGRVLPTGWDRAGFTGKGWAAAHEVLGPGGRLTPGQAAPMVVAQQYAPLRVTTLKPGTVVYDLGENMSGWPRITVRGIAGAKVTMIAGELLNSDGTVSQKSANAFPDAPVLFIYTLRGGQVETWHPRFAYYSFRYVEIRTEGQADVLSLNGDFVHAEAPVVGRFSSSNPLLQKIHNLIDRAVLSNLASVVTDCPSREKLGWLEQTYLNAATLMLNYDVTGLYEKMSADMRDAQLADGLVPSIAPEYVAFVDAKGKSNAFRDSPEWGSAVILSPWALYQHTGDSRALAASYEAMQRYAAYLATRSDHGLLNYGLGDWYDIGPKAPGPSQLTSKIITATGVYYEDLTTLSKIADLLGHPRDVARYKDEAELVREAFNRKMFHPETNSYDRGSQTANALPLALGLVPPERVAGVLDHLVTDIRAHDDHVTAGDVGFHYVVRALTDYGRSDVLAAMFLRTDSPSYGYQLARGATTLTEAWDANPASSQNHFMLGHGEEWFYRGLAGLSIDMARGADDAVQMRPSFLDGVSEASASSRSPMGTVEIRWSRSVGAMSVDVTIPVGARGHLKLPKGGLWMESLESRVEAESQSDGARESDRGDLTLGSGTYRFTRP